MKSLRAPVMALRFLVTHSRLLVLGGDVVPGVPVEDHIGEFIVCQLTVREAALPLPAPKPGVREGPLGAPPCVAPPPASSADQAHSRQPSARAWCMICPAAFPQVCTSSASAPSAKVPRKKDPCGSLLNQQGSRSARLRGSTSS